jgi:hypothetical protein
MLYLCQFTLYKSHYMGKDEYEKKIRLVDIEHDVNRLGQVQERLQAVLDKEYRVESSYSLDITVNLTDFESVLYEPR